MNPQHTPGPWTNETRNKTVINAGDKHVALVNFWLGPDPSQCVKEHQANVNLIIAAPDLLEAVQALLTADAGCLCGHFETCSNCSPSPKMRTARQKARIALNKAKGIQP